ncbi:MAG: HEAT repeat domain-containing protein [Planctomycetota bacterium]|nr:MAG: HEAT repeat domain-containing protein [Planctomycetota bacterium]
MGSLKYAVRSVAARRVLLGALCLVAPLGCAGSGEGEKSWEEVRAERVRTFMLHLNNPSETERHRDGLIAVGQRSAEDRDYVLAECERAYAESMRRGGVGTGVLRTPGRRRVMEVVTALGETPQGRSLLQRGLEDDEPVALAAAAGLLEWGDGGAVPRLVRAVLSLPPGDPVQAKGLAALRRAAKPGLRDAYLKALGSTELDALRPVVLATFPSDPEERARTLRRVARAHPNPYARRFALRALVELEDPEATAVAREALEKKDAVLRPVALEALGAVGGAQAVDEIVAVLRREPRDAEAVVRGLFEAGTPEAIDRAVELLGDGELSPRTRAALAKAFFARMKEDGAPAIYRRPESLEAAGEALRAALEEREPLLVAAAVEALGRIGDREVDVDSLLALLADPSPRVAPKVVEALGRLGGEFACAKLVELIASDPGLRPHALTALRELEDKRDVPVAELIDLLESEDVDVRRAALKALKALRGSRDAFGYDPSADEDARSRAADAWRAWWRKRRGS